MLKVEIYEDGRFIGTLRIKDRWLGLLPVDEEEIRQEIEQRLPTLKKARYTIAFT